MNYFNDNIRVMSIDKVTKADGSFEIIALETVKNANGLSLMDEALLSYLKLEEVNKIIPENELFRPRCVRTNSGRFVNIFEPTSDMIVVEDIAFALSNIPRFGGHLPKESNRYSVLQHCLYGAAIAPAGYKFPFLMHEAAEAYMVDLPAPIKIEIPQYKAIENNLMEFISKMFGFKYQAVDPVLKKVDNILLGLEYVNIMINKHPSPFIDDIFPVDKCEQIFLDTFYSFTKNQTHLLS